MHQKRSLDDTCDVFLSRSRINSPSLLQRSASEFPQYSPTLSTDGIKNSSCFFLPRSLGYSEAIDTKTSSASLRPLPLPGSSGILPPKPTRSANGRHHIPRPRNPFILFRCDFVHQRKMQPRADVDDTNISRIAGEIWREMTAEEKRPWVELAAWEKERHAILFPDYKYAPVQGGSKAKKGKNENMALDEHTARQLSQMITALSAEYATQSSSSEKAETKPAATRGRRQPERSRPYPQPQAIPRRRSSSCPPVGAVPVQAFPELESWIPSLVAQDDLKRRPSRTVMYQSVRSQPHTEPFFPIPTGYRLPFSFQDNNWLSSPEPGPWMPDLNAAYPTSDATLLSEPESTYFFGNKPVFSPGARDPEITVEELLRIQSLSLGSTFTDPFSSPPTDANSPADDLNYSFPAPISPLDCSGYSSGSSSPGGFSAN